MEIKRIRVKLKSDIQRTTPLFYNYIDVIKRKKLLKVNAQLTQSKLYGGFAIIEAPSKLISGIINYENLKE